MANASAVNNFYPLPEWYPQDATLLVWPHRYSDWSHMLDEISQTYLSLTQTITQYQRVIIIYFNDEHKQYITKLCSEYGCNMEKLVFITIETNDTWVRDYGPQILFGDTGYQYIDFEFNAWGEQYPCRLDNLFAENFFHYINEQHCEYYRTPFVIEGGNLEFDSQANLLTNIACIRENNPYLTLRDDDIIKKLTYEFSAKHVLTIDVPPLKGDDTGGHIDTLARFINDETIVFSYTYDENNPNQECLLLLEEQLKTLKNQHGRHYSLFPIALPKQVFLNEDDDYLPASYVNFVFINNAVIVPLYKDEHDQLALDSFTKLCPEKNIIGIEANYLLEQFGSLHCATLHIPENVLREDI